MKPVTRRYRTQQVFHTLGSWIKATAKAAANGSYQALVSTKKCLVDHTHHVINHARRTHRYLKAARRHEKITRVSENQVTIGSASRAATGNPPQGEHSAVQFYAQRNAQVAQMAGLRLDEVPPLAFRLEAPVRYCDRMLFTYTEDLSVSIEGLSGKLHARWSAWKKWQRKKAASWQWTITLLGTVFYMAKWRGHGDFMSLTAVGHAAVVLNILRIYDGVDWLIGYWMD
ncbi:MAG: hypothetical protein Q9208_007182 [Pyrenodesmia sp. 3 TL-2023]